MPSQQTESTSSSFVLSFTTQHTSSNISTRPELPATAASQHRGAIRVLPKWQLRARPKKALAQQLSWQHRAARAPATLNQNPRRRSIATPIELQRPPRRFGATLACFNKAPVRFIAAPTSLQRSPDGASITRGTLHCSLRKRSIATWQTSLHHRKQSTPRWTPSVLSSTTKHRLTPSLEIHGQLVL